jgi:hypothetical protein
MAPKRVVPGPFCDSEGTGLSNLRFAATGFDNRDIAIVPSAQAFERRRG